MAKIRLSVPEEEETENNTNLNYKKFISSFINNTLNEMKSQLSGYHSSKEIECRKKLISFFKQKVADFELIYLLDVGIKYLNSVKIFKTVNNFEDTANRLAYVYENIKNTISPSWNVKGSLRNLYYNNLPAQSQETNNKHLERFLKIHLQKENLQYFKSVKIKDNFIFLDEKYKITLCGEMGNPKFMLLDSEIFIRNFTISKFVTYLKLQDKYYKLHNLHSKFKILKNQIEMILEGGYLNFKILIDNQHFKAEENINIDKFIEKLSNKYQNLNFTLENGWFAFYDKGNLVDCEKSEKQKNFIFKNEVEICEFLKNNFFHSATIKFFNPKLYLKFVDLLKKEKFFFREIEKIYKGTKILRNYNEIMIDNLRLKIVGLKDEIIDFDIFIDENQFCIKNNGILIFEKKTTSLPISNFKYLIRNTSIKYISDFYNFIKDESNYINLIKMTEFSLEVIFENFNISIFSEFCLVGDFEIKNTRTYINFIFNIYRYADNILERYLEVEIEGFKFKYDINTNKIMTQIKNREIIGYKNINYILKNLKYFYKYNLVPDYVFDSYAIFKFDVIFKIGFSKNLSDDLRTWFRNLPKLIHGKGNINLDIEEFLKMYGYNKFK
ncbi:uncharacterized protein VNE69_07093 [Vairimorpha necatrix]|uniref:Uncharacterized protein n=1 Tax=Vairimorpha necatrix TaxID=6039 RepID=A0AAX4JDD2_9MICR